MGRRIVTDKEGNQYLQEEPRPSGRRVIVTTDESGNDYILDAETGEWIG